MLQYPSILFLTQYEKDKNTVRFTSRIVENLEKQSKAVYVFVISTISTTEIEKYLSQD